MSVQILKTALVAATLAVALPLATVTSTPVLAAGSHTGGHGMSKTGKPAKAKDATRTIEVVMFDNYYEPEKIEIKEGETVRFLVKNAGEFVHEFSIATAAMHVAHQPEMMMMMEHGVLEADKINWEAAKKMQAKMGHGMHKDENSLLLEPGKSGEITWTFPKHAELQFACNVPGHYDAGMQGSFHLSH